MLTLKLRNIGTQKGLVIPNSIIKLMQWDTSKEVTMQVYEHANGKHQLHIFQSDREKAKQEELLFKMKVQVSSLETDLNNLKEIMDLFQDQKYKEAYNRAYALKLYDSLPKDFFRICKEKLKEKYEQGRDEIDSD